jgi:hypothetical protein
LSCSAGDTQLGAGFCRDLQQAFFTDVGHHAAAARASIALDFSKRIYRWHDALRSCSRINMVSMRSSFRSR